MDEYEIIYDYTDEGGFEIKNITERFYGTYDELQDYINKLRALNCYYISATYIGE